MASTGGWSTPYRTVIGSRIRAQRSFPASFALDLFGSLLVGLTELAEVWVIFHNVKVLGGLDLNAILLLFGLSNLAFSAADLLVGHVDNLPTFVRMGTIDVFYLRPQPVLAQLVTCEFSLRRLARIGVALVALTAGLTHNDIAWGPPVVARVLIAVVCGTAIFAGLFVCAAQPAVLSHQRLGADQQLHLRGLVCRVAARLDLSHPAEDDLRLPRPRRLHGIPADAGDPAAARTVRSALVARVG